jgi:hypothetical protein
VSLLFKNSISEAGFTSIIRQKYETVSPVRDTLVGRQKQSQHLKRFVSPKTNPNRGFLYCDTVSSYSQRWFGEPCWHNFQLWSWRCHSSSKHGCPPIRLGGVTTLKTSKLVTELSQWRMSNIEAGPIPDEVIGFFNGSNPSSRTMALGSTQPLTEMNTRNLPGCKGRPARKADNLTAICQPIVWKMWKPRRLTTLWVSMACYRDRFSFHVSIYLHIFIISL